MAKYKVLLPTNGHQPGDVVELTAEEAANFNAGEPTPRVEIVEEEAAQAAEAAAPAGDTPEGEKQDGGPASEEETKPAEESAAPQEGAAAEPAAEGESEKANG